AWICKSHGLLVERREANGLRVTCLGKLQCGAEVVGRESSSNQCGLATDDTLRIEIFQVDEDMLAHRHARRIFDIGILQIKLDTCDARAFVQNTTIPENDEMRFFLDIRQGDRK